MKRFSLVLLVAATAGACRSDPSAGQTRAAPEPIPPGNPATAAAPAAPQGGSPAANVKIGGLATCQPSVEISSSVTRLIDLADTDSNGQVSRDEARAGMNFLLGGLFFRADDNADGKITPEEGRKVRTELDQQHPAVGALLKQVRESTGKSPFQTIAQLVNVDYGQTVTLEDARAAARTALDDLFRVADTDKNDVIGRQEAISASWEGVRSLGRHAFSAADTNDDGYLSTSEFEDVLTGSAKAVFSLADTDDDGRLTEKEAAIAMNTAARQLGVSQGQPNR
jgi:hypothetical protein